MNPGYYLCPMMLQKIHPEFDWALGEILRRDPQAEVVLFADSARARSGSEQLERRFAAEMPDVAERICFRPFARQEEFLNLLLQADCVLDPFHFSGGVTTYIALSLGVPVVTLPGELFRSRMTAGMYAQAGITACTARSREHYVELALEFAAIPGCAARLGADRRGTPAPVRDARGRGRARGVDRRSEPRRVTCRAAVGRSAGTGSRGRRGRTRRRSGRRL